MGGLKYQHRQYNQRIQKMSYDLVFSGKEWMIRFIWPDWIVTVVAFKTECEVLSWLLEVNDSLNKDNAIHHDEMEWCGLNGE